MSAQPETVPQQEQSFDEAVSEFLRQPEPEGVTPQENVASTPAAQAPPATAPAQGQQAETPAPQATEEINWQERAQAAEAARQKAENERWSAEGRLRAAQKRQEQKDAELAEAKGLLDNENARHEKLFKDAIASEPDETRQLLLSLQFRAEKAERDLQQQTAEQERTRKQADEFSTWEREQRVQQADSGVRSSAIPSLLQVLEGHAATVGIPVSELADLRASITGSEVQLLARTLPIIDRNPLAPDLTKWMNYRADQLVQEIEQRKAAWEEKQAAGNRQAAAGTYRAEQPVGQAGGQGPRTIDDMDFDEAAAYMFGRGQQ